MHWGSTGVKGFEMFWEIVSCRVVRNFGSWLLTTWLSWISLAACPIATACAKTVLSRSASKQQLVEIASIWLVPMVPCVDFSCGEYWQRVSNITNDYRGQRASESSDTWHWKRAAEASPRHSVPQTAESHDASIFKTNSSQKCPLRHLLSPCFHHRRWLNSCHLLQVFWCILSGGVQQPISCAVCLGNCLRCSRDAAEASDSPWGANLLHLWPGRDRNLRILVASFLQLAALFWPVIIHALFGRATVKS